MIKKNAIQQEPTAVDDVRRVRETIAKQHGGNIREHMAETNRIFESLREKLHLKMIAAPSKRPRNGSGG